VTATSMAEEYVANAGSSTPVMLAREPVAVALLASRLKAQVLNAFTGQSTKQQEIVGGRW